LQRVTTETKILAIGNVPGAKAMDEAGDEELVNQEARALLARLAAVGNGSFARVLVDCLASAHQALHACTSDVLLHRLRDELELLAQHCHQEAESLAARWDTATTAIGAAAASEIQAARHIARAARELAELARLKARC
jgi:transposase-like protein